MNSFRPRSSFAALTSALILLAATAATAGVSSASPSSHACPLAVQSDVPAGAQVAHGDGADSREPHSCCKAAESHRHSRYNDEYIFGLTRGVAGSTMHPAARILVFPVTVPLDFALLPFEVIGGLF